MCIEQTFSLSSCVSDERGITVGIQSYNTGLQIRGSYHNWPALYQILVLIAYEKTFSLNMHAQLSRGATGVKWG